MSDWISVEENLPENDGGFVRVIAAIKGEWSGEAFFNPKTKHFLNEGFIAVSPVTHWMPLPEPPHVD